MVLFSFSKVFPWDHVFGKKLSHGVDGLVVVANDQCGSDPWTFQIDGPEVVKLGKVDMHDPTYDDFAFTFSFDQDHEGAGDCHYQFTVYPSDTFHQNYVTSKPAIYAIAIVAIFLTTAFVFIWFDVLVERRQRHAATRLTNLRARAAAEKSLLMVQSANKAARAERDLNDYIAHEVRFATLLWGLCDCCS